MKGERYDRGGLVFADDALHGNRARCGRSGRNLLCTVVACLLSVCCLTYKAEAVVFDRSGQALKVVHASHEALLDKVIAATKVGVQSSSTGQRVTGWAVGRWGGGAIAPMTSIAIGIVGLAWSPYIEPWLDSKGWWVADGAVMQEGAGGQWVATAHAGSRKYGNTIFLIFPDASTAEAAWNQCTGGAYNCTFGDWSTGWWNCRGRRMWTTSLRDCLGLGDTGWSYVEYLYPTGSGYVEWQSGEPVVVSDGSYNTAYESDFAAGNELVTKSAVDLIDYMGNLIENANREWPGVVPDPEGYGPLSDEQADIVQQALNDGIDEAAKEKLEEMADANGTMQPDGSVAHWEDWEYSPEAIATAIDAKEREREAAWENDWEAPDNGSVIEAGSWEAPERRELGSVLDTFIAGLNNLPLVSWLTGYTIELSGATSVVTLAVPAYMGGSIEVDFADYESILDTVGNGLYAVVGLACLLFLFRGRGD